MSQHLTTDEDIFHVLHQIKQATDRRLDDLERARQAILQDHEVQVRLALEAHRRVAA